jgi:hypothetical protein
MSLTSALSAVSGPSIQTETAGAALYKEGKKEREKQDLVD